MKTGRFTHKSLRIVVALLLSFFIVLQGRWHLIGEAFASPSFYMALAVSFSITYLLIFFVYKSNAVLNRYFPWKKGVYTRFFLQILIGIALPALVDLLLVMIYFEAIGGDIISTGFMQFDFPMIIAFLIFLNGYYGISQFEVVNEHIDDKCDPSIETFTINYNGIYMKLSIPNDILFLYKEGKLVKVFTVTGKEYAIPETIVNLHTRFSKLDYSQINRSTIVNVRTVKGYVTGTKRDTLQVLFKEEYDGIIKKNELEWFRVTKDNIHEFRETFERMEFKTDKIGSV